MLSITVEVWKEFAVIIPWPLAVFEYFRMEQRNKKEEILLLYCLPSTNMVGSHRFWSKSVRIQHTNCTYYVQVTSLFSTPAYTWFVPDTVWLFQHHSGDATLVVDLQAVNYSSLLVKEDGQSAIDTCGVHRLLFISILPSLHSCEVGSLLRQVMSMMMMKWCNVAVFSGLILQTRTERGRLSSAAGCHWLKIRVPTIDQCSLFLRVFLDFLLVLVW